MILHAAELWLVIAACFLVGCLVGSLIYRTTSLTAAARLQSHAAHGIDRAIRIVEWRLFPWRARGPVPLPRTVPVPAPDYGAAVAPSVPIPLQWGDDPAEIVASPSLEPGIARSAFDAESLRDAVDHADALGTRPAVIASPRGGRADDLSLIKGLGKRQAARLARIGIYHFSQVAAWTPQEAAWIGAYLGVGDAVREKDWIGQATRVAGSDDPDAALRPPSRSPDRPRARRGRSKKAKAAEAAEKTPDASGERGIDPVEKPADP